MSDQAKVMNNWAVQLSAMDAADTKKLRDCFTADAVLVHLTGLEQSVDEWMAGIEAGEFVYHKVVERGAGCMINGDRAQLVGDIVTGVQSDGSGQAWPLHVEQELVRERDGWRVRVSRVTLARGRH